MNRPSVGGGNRARRREADSVSSVPLRPRGVSSVESVEELVCWNVRELLTGV